jgi:hypothetical protein
MAHIGLILEGGEQLAVANGYIGKPQRRAPAKQIAGRLGVPRRSDLGEGSAVGVLDHTRIELPGVIESGMPKKNGQREPGTTRGLPGRSRVATALRVSRHAVKSQCVPTSGADDPRQHNLDPSEGPRDSHADRAVDPTRSGTIEPLRAARQVDANCTPVGVCREQAKLEGLRECAVHAGPPAVPVETRRSE